VIQIQENTRTGIQRWRFFR